jgi:hypothetical protein
MASQLPTAVGADRTLRNRSTHRVNHREGALLTAVVLAGVGLTLVSTGVVAAVLGFVPLTLLLSVAADA